MTKTVSGIVLIAGLAVAAVGIGTALWASTADLGPTMDGTLDVIRIAAFIGAVAGLVAFFVGAMRFSRG